jgi:hypothetical protein
VGKMSLIEKIKSVAGAARNSSQSIKSTATEKTELLIEKYRSQLREKAIGKVKSKLITAGKTVEDLSHDEIEHLVKEEEEEIIARLKKSGALAVLAFFGVT